MLGKTIKRAMLQSPKQLVIHEQLPKTLNLQLPKFKLKHQIKTKVILPSKILFTR